MKIVIVDGCEVGILSREEYQARTFAIVRGEAVERRDLKLFAATEEEAPRAVELSRLGEDFCEKLS